MTVEHVKSVMDKLPKEEHGLQKCDVDASDKQNVDAVMRVSFRRVTNCMRKVFFGVIDVNGAFFEQPGSEGTILHLEFIHSYLNILYGNGSLIERIFLASLVFHLIEEIQGG